MWLTKCKKTCYFFPFCLLIITTIAIIKANVMIVTITKEQNNMYMMLINDVSIIRLTSFKEANHICLFSFPMSYNIQHLLINFKRTY